MLSFLARQFAVRPFPCLASAVMLATAGHAVAQHVHQHGVSQLDIAVQGDALLISLHGPAHNFVGFEHAPQTGEERSQHHQALAKLRAGAGLFGLPDAAGCTLADVAVETGSAHSDHGGPDPEHEHEHEHRHEHGHDHGHADWQADYTYDCKAAQSLTAVTVRVFEHYPETTEIRYQLAGDGAQGGGTLQRGNNRIGMR